MTFDPEHCTTESPDLPPGLPDPEPPPKKSKRKRDENGMPPRPDAATRALEYVLDSGAECWLSTEGEAFVTAKHHGHVECFPARSSACRDFVNGLFYAKEGRALSPANVQAVTGTLKAKAAHDGIIHPAARRVCQYQGTVLLDLGSPSWEIVEIQGHGWRIIPANEAPVRFYRPKGMLELPKPQRGGRLDDLQAFLNLKSDRDWGMIAAWLVCAMGCIGKYPILVISGEAGSAKSTTCRVIRGLVDPNVSPLRSLSKEPRDIYISGKNQHVLVIDNLSNLPVWASDEFCRIALGAGYAARELFSDSDEALFSGSNPIVLNGIADVATRGDLASRSLPVSLTSIPDDRRRAEAKFWEEYEQAAPPILGALLSAVSCALHNIRAVTEKVSLLPRLADAALWVEAASPVLGWPQGTFLQYLKDGQQDLAAVSLEGDPLYEALMLSSANWEDGRITATSTELLRRLLKFDGIDHNHPKWPKDATRLSRRLTELAPLLRSQGWDLSRVQQGHDKTRVITLASPTPIQEKNLSKENIASAASAFGGSHDL